MTEPIRGVNPGGRSRKALLMWVVFAMFAVLVSLSWLSIQTISKPANSLKPVTAPNTAIVPADHSGLIAMTSLERLPRASEIKTVKVAAIQCYSRMGKMAYNRKLLTDLITSAANQNAKIIVLPECALQGYMDPADGQKWGRDAASGECIDVKEAAEHVPGPSTSYFSGLANRLHIYLTLPLIEVSDERYFNTLVLLGPDGKLLARHRKFDLWTPGDGEWADPGDGSAKVVSTQYGRLGLMICYDIHAMPKRLKAAGADIVLYSVGWYGPQSEAWFRDILPRRHVIPNNFAVIAANWCRDENGNKWEGQGYSCVIGRDGKTLSMAEGRCGPEIVFAELPVPANTSSDDDE